MVTADRDEARRQLLAVLQDAVWPFLDHDPYNPDVFWGLMADKVEAHFAAERDQLRTELADLLDGDPVPWLRMRDRALAAEREAAGLRAQVQAAGAEALNEAADEYAKWSRAAWAENMLPQSNAIARVHNDLRARAAALVPTNPDMRGYSMWFDRESWGHIIDGLVAALDDARKRKAMNPDSTSDARAAEISNLIGAIGLMATISGMVCDLMVCDRNRDHGRHSA